MLLCILGSCVLVILAWWIYREVYPPIAVHRGSHYERHGNKDRVLVFIHGIFGNAEDTWTAPPNIYWPKLILSDKTFDNTDVYVAGYDTPILGNTMTIDEIVGNLNEHLKSDHVFSEHREVIFVCHSLGGLIVQQLLLTFREYAEKVRLIYFYSTPQTGAEIAKLPQLFDRDPLVRELEPGESNDYLRHLEAEWKSAKFRIPRYCAYEKLKYNGILVVDELSATRNCDRNVAINANHSTIVKPAKPTDDPYVMLSNAWSELFPFHKPTPRQTATIAAEPTPISRPTVTPEEPLTPPPPDVEFKIKVENEKGDGIASDIACASTPNHFPPSEWSEDGTYTCTVSRDQKYVWVSIKPSGYAKGIKRRFEDLTTNKPHIITLEHEKSQ